MIVVWQCAAANLSLAEHPIMEGVIRILKHAYAGTTNRAVPLPLHPFGLILCICFITVTRSKITISPDWGQRLVVEMSPSGLKKGLYTKRPEFSLVH